jgi:hypothetical protein
MADPLGPDRMTRTACVNIRCNLKRHENQMQLAQSVTRWTEFEKYSTSSLSRMHALTKCRFEQTQPPKTLKTEVAARQLWIVKRQFRA